MKGRIMNMTMSILAQAAEGNGTEFSTPMIIGLVVAGIVVLAFLALFLPVFGLWIQALAARAGVGIFSIIGMRLRKVNPQIIVLARIQAVRAGVSTDRLAKLTAPHLDGLDEATMELIAKLRMSEEGQEGMAAFLGGRKPSWANN